MLQPKRTKFRRAQKGRIKEMHKEATAGVRVIWYQSAWAELDHRKQIEGSRQGVTRYMKKREGQCGSEFSQT